MEIKLIVDQMVNLNRENIGTRGAQRPIFLGRFMPFYISSGPGREKSNFPDREFRKIQVSYKIPLLVI